MSTIYQITNILTNQSYIGKTTKLLQQRWKQHIQRYKRLDTFLYRAMRKYGIHAFTVTVIEENIPPEIINAREIYWILTLNTYAPAGYNLTTGGDGRNTGKSPQYIEGMKRRDYTGDKNPMYGKTGLNNLNYGSKRSDEQRAHQASQILQAWSDNTVRKDLASARMTGTNNHRYGKKPPNAVCVEFNGKTYYSLAEAARDNNRSPQYIRKYGIIHDTLST